MVFPHLTIRWPGRAVPRPGLRFTLAQIRAQRRGLGNLAIL
jgi:hypothetical protein